MPITHLYKILLAKDQQLHPQFLQLFSKHVIHSPQPLIFPYFSQSSLYLPYSQLSKYLLHLPQVARGSMQSPNKYKPHSKLFAFQSCTNNVVMMLDLTSYMLRYDYQAKTMPITGLQAVVKDLINKLKQKRQELVQMYRQMAQQYTQYDWKVDFTLTVYMFSIYEPTPTCIIYRQDITPSSLPLLSQFILNSIHSSLLPYMQFQTKHNISQVIQKILDLQQPIIGMRSILIVSSFNEKEVSSKIFFTSNWYTFGFVNVAQHMGSYLLQENQVRERFGSSSFFQVKYFFSTRFLENWQKVDQLKNPNNSFLTTTTEKHKTIMYTSQNKAYKNIFNQLLQFKVQIKNKNAANSLHEFGKGQGSAIKVLQFPKKNYRINQCNFDCLLRIRYQQGWQPVLQQKKNQKISKCIFKLDFNPFICMIYKAQLQPSPQGSFYTIQIFSKISSQSIRKSKPSLQSHQLKSKQLLFQLIQNIDLIHTSRYKSIYTNLIQQQAWRRRSVMNPFSQNDEVQSRSLRFVLSNTQQWGKFAKIRYVSFGFYPRLNKTLFEEFLNQIAFFIGDKISESIFMKRNWDKGDKPDHQQHKMQFSQLIRKFNMIKIKLAYVNYSFKQIKQVLDPFIYKFQTKKLKSGDAIIMNDELFKFNSLFDINSEKMFQNKWKLKIKDDVTFKIFNYYFKALLKDQYFEQVGDKRTNFTSKSYAKRILVNQVKQCGLNSQQNIVLPPQKLLQKSLFCNIQFHACNQIIFTFLMFPLISKLCPIHPEPLKYNGQQCPPISKQFRKQISAYDLFFQYTESIKFMQTKIMKIIFTYNQIHQLLLVRMLNKINKKGLQMGSKLKHLVKDFYQFRNIHFEDDYSELIQYILATYYNIDVQQKSKEINESHINIDFIPEPQKFLIQADVDQIRGDLTLKKDSKQYTYFLFSPYHPIYISRKNNKFYYKDINLMYQDISIQQADPQSIIIMIKQIQQIIKNEQYRKLYSKIFYRPQQLQKITQAQSLQKNQIDFDKLIRKISTYNPPSKFVVDFKSLMKTICMRDCEQLTKQAQDCSNSNHQKQQNSNKLIWMTQDVQYNSLMQERIKPLIKQFVATFYQIFQIYFSRNVGDYHFQRDYLKESRINIKRSFQKEKLQHFNQLILKNYIKIGDKQIILKSSNFQQLIFQHARQLASGKAQFILSCFCKLSQKQNQTYSHFTKSLCVLIKQLQIEINRVKICKSSELDSISRLIDQQGLAILNQCQRISLSRLYQPQSFQRLSRYIQSSVLQKPLYLHKLVSQSYTYISLMQISLTKQSKQTHLSIPFWLKLQITNKEIQIHYREYQYFMGDGMELRVREYLERLVDLVNCDYLIMEMTSTRELPLQPYQLFISQLVNHPTNKLVQTKRKSNLKKGMRGIRGRIGSQKQQSLGKLTDQNTITNKTSPVPLIYKNSLNLNDRFRPGDGLQAIKKYQSFQVFQIMNLKNTYLFPNFINKQNIIFHFQQQKCDPSLSQVNVSQLQSQKAKKLLTYYVYCLNTSISKSQIQKIFSSILYQALNQRVFQFLSHQLYIAPQTIQPIQQKQFKSNDNKKSFTFDIPFIPFVDDFKGYLKQHVLMYHTKTEFKSEKRPTNTKRRTQNGNKHERSASISSSNKNSFHKNQDTLSKSKDSFGMSVDLSSSMTLPLNYQKNLIESSSSFSVFDEPKKGLSFGIKQNSYDRNQYQQCIPTMWLFNFKKNLKLQAKFGKCVYLLKLDITHNISTVQNVKIWQKTGANRKKKQFIGCNLSQQQKKSLRDYLNGPNVKKSSNMDLSKPMLKTYITFNIIHYLGSPILSAMQQVFLSIIRTSISDYYIQNSLNHNLLHMSHPSQSSFLKSSLHVDSQMKELNFIKSKSQNVRMDGLESQGQRDSMFDKMNRQVEQVDGIVRLSTNQSLFKVVTTQHVLIKDLKIYFKHCYAYLRKLLEQTMLKTLPIIFYVQFKDKNQPVLFWTESQNDTVLKDHLTFVAQKIQTLQGIERMGFILNEQLLQLLETSKNPLLLSQKPTSISLQPLQGVKIFVQQKSFCLSQYNFSRSLYLHYQISANQFVYYSYNVNIFLNNKINEYLLPLENWLEQKYRLLKFIKSVKEQQEYQVVAKEKRMENKFGFIFQLYLETLKSNKRKQDQKRIKHHQAKHITLTKILISLVFDDYPLNYNDNTFMDLTNQIQEIFEMLRNTPIKYKGMPQYKGKQKCLLQKLGRQYISLLKHQHGWRQHDQKSRNDTGKSLDILNDINGTGKSLKIVNDIIGV